MGWRREHQDAAGCRRSIRTRLPDSDAGADRAAQALVSLHKDIKPIVVFHADCVGRSADQVGKDVAFSEVRATIDAFPEGTPWFGAYVYGELASVGGKAAFHNWTGAIASMYIE